MLVMERILDMDIRRIRTMEELEQALGELTPAEKARLNDPALYDPPTDEELARLPRDFTEKVMALARRRRGPDSETRTRNIHIGSVTL